MKKEDSKIYKYIEQIFSSKLKKLIDKIYDPLSICIGTILLIMVLIGKTITLSSIYLYDAIKKPFARV